VTELSSNIGALKEHVVDYPPALSAALVSALWEATFSTRIARQATEQRDVAYVAGCLFRAVGVTAHALHGHAREWLLNEKGAIASTSRLPDSPVDFEQRVNDAFSSLATDPAALTSACDQLDDLIGDATQIVAA
jgi:hypothetical protein